jgi:hypothetical protein
MPIDTQVDNGPIMEVRNVKPRGMLVVRFSTSVESSLERQ